MQWKANLDVEWDIPAAPEWTLSMRATYTDSHVNSANTQQIPSWTRYDLGARYTAKLWGQSPAHPRAHRLRSMRSAE
ncbi:MAG: TonB-dependent receptor [Gammaproteobacteria bacterium]|nr:TonB-dependent receptor [Gammaproteobacteria bacterium]